MSGNPLGMPTNSYSGDTPDINRLLCHCYTIPPSWNAGETTVVGYLEAWLFYDGTDTVLMTTGGYVTDYEQLLEGREIKGTSTFMREIG